MHELGIAQNIVEIVANHAQGAPVVRVAIEIGQLSGISAEAMQFCFQSCIQGTPLEGARLDIEEVPGLGRCQSCGALVRLEVPFGMCPHCEGVRLAIVQGCDLKVKELEVGVCA